MSDITILGRGESIKMVKDFPIKSNKVILVNEFWSCSYSPKSFCEEPFLKASLQDKDISLLCSPYIATGAGLTKVENDFNITAKYNNVWPKGHNTGREMPPLNGWQALPVDCIEIYKQLTSNTTGGGKEQNCLRGSLTYAILLAIGFYNAKHITIFGQDFYEAGYLLKQTLSHAYDRSMASEIKRDFNTLFSFFEDIDFTIYTYSSFESNLNNVHVIK